MAQIKVRTTEGKEYKIEGNIIFETQLINSTKEEEIKIGITGQLVTHYFIEDIEEIETHRYILKDIQVYKETFSSNDFNILYEFEAIEYEVKKGITNLDKQKIKEIEEIIYKEDESKRWE